MTGKIVVIFNDKVVSEHAISNQETTIGRRFANDIHIDNLGISGNHAKIMLFGNNAFIEDLDSTNGTFVNGTKVEKKALQSGDIITLGKYQLRYEANEGEQQDDFEKTVILQANAVSMEEATKPAPKPATKPAALKASLVVNSGKSAGKAMQITKTVTRLGKPGNQAAAIARRPQGYFFVNLGSDVTPTVNGKSMSVGALRLKGGDQITIGTIELTFNLR